MSLSTNAGFVFVNSQTRPGTITIPNIYATIGRVITFKDSIGTFQFSTLTLATQTNQFVDNAQVSSIQRSRFGWTTLVQSSNTWFQTSGTQINSITTSTINVDYVSSSAVVLSNLAVSSIFFRDVAQSSISTMLFFSSAYLYYSTPNTNAIVSGGPRQSFGTQYLSVRA